MLASNPTAKECLVTLLSHGQASSQRYWFDLHKDVFIYQCSAICDKRGANIQLLYHRKLIPTQNPALLKGLFGNDSERTRNPTTRKKKIPTQTVTVRTLTCKYTHKHRG